MLAGAGGDGALDEDEDAALGDGGAAGGTAGIEDAAANEDSALISSLVIAFVPVAQTATPTI